MALVTENQLDEWVRGHARDAQGVVVELISRLVAASCPRPLDRRFPLPDSIGQHGPDGVLDAPVGDGPFVPDGKSYWEIGTGQRAGDKATSDYADLTDTVPVEVRRETTFMFVTPLSACRDWEYSWKEVAQARWLKERLNRSEWKDVRVVDGTKLVNWCHQFPAVEFWLAGRMGIPTEQLETLGERWDVLRSIGEPPPLTPQVFLANREETCARLRDVLNDDLTQLKLATHFPDQVVDFVAAYVSSLEDGARIEALGRCVIISAPDAWNVICALRSKHVLIADKALDLNGDAGTKLIQRARRAGHSVVFGGPRGGIPDPTTVELGSPRAHHVRDALVASGYLGERARVLAQKTNGNLSTLLRFLQNASLLPEWAERGDAAELAVAEFFGSWDESSDGDRLEMEKLAGKAYGEWIRTIREMSVSPNTPLAQNEGQWKFVARYEGWYALGPRIFDDHLSRFLEIARSVLAEHDPQFELSAEERFAAAIRGKTLKHSTLLRSGIAETLALLGNHARALTSCTAGKPESVAAIVVQELLTDTTWNRWAELNGIMPLLAEAAPDRFLDAVDKALLAQPCPFDELFAQEGRGLAGRNYMTGLLWALETLAWETSHLMRVSASLAGLATRDPGGQWANRPLNSLKTIFMPWLPQTSAPIPRRLAAVKLVLVSAPIVGWKLLLGLLPARHGVSHGSRRPAWREGIPETFDTKVTGEAYVEQVSAYADLAVDQAKAEVSHLGDLIGRLDELPRPAYERIRQHLGSHSVKQLPETDRMLIWNKIDSLAKQHTKFADADWAMGPADVSALQAIADEVAPTTPIYRHQRLFTERALADLLEAGDDYAQFSDKLEKQREDAVAQIISLGTIQEVLRFAGTVESPWRVGVALGSLGPPGADDAVIPALLESADKTLSQLAAGFVRARFHKLGWTWADRVAVKLSVPEQIGQFLSFLPFTQEAWIRASQLLPEHDSAYWTKTPANQYEAKGELKIAVEALLRHGRPLAALRCIRLMLDNPKSFDPSLASRALMATNKSSEPPNQLDSYHIVEIIKAIQSDERLDRNELYRVEWTYLTLLDKHSNASPVGLERLLATDPLKFCELIRMLYRSRKEPSQGEESSEEQKDLAMSSFDLLERWSVPPGMREDGVYDGDALSKWLNAVKMECVETGHLEVAMSRVGHVMTHVPSDPQGLWIDRAAAAALDAADADDMRRGFQLQIRNSRGVHWVDPTGKPERDLAAKYRVKATDLDSAGFARLAGTMRALAETYDQEAERVASRHKFEDLG